MISTRLLFGGNMTKQPCFVDGKVKYRIAGNLKNTDYVMNNTFWIGVYPGIGKKQTEYAASVIKEFVEKKMKPD